MKTGNDDSCFLVPKGVTEMHGRDPRSAPGYQLEPVHSFPYTTPASLSSPLKRREAHVAKSTTCILFILISGVAHHAIAQQQLPRQAFVYSGEFCDEIAFPIGGIGTGSVSLGGRGDLRDWEIFNRPDYGSRMDFTFFAIWAKRTGQPPVARILERRFTPPYRGGGHGIAQRQLSGLPRLDSAEFRGEYPFATIKFRDRGLPVHVELNAWNPFIPLNVDDSALPAAVFSWTVSNPTADTVDIGLAGSIVNPIGSRYTNVRGERPGLGQNLNEYAEASTFRGLRLSSLKIKPDDPGFGTMALATTWPEVNVQTRWYRGGWWDQCHLFWDDFADDGRIKEVRDTALSSDNRSDVGTMVLRAKIPPHRSVTLPIVLTWHFPNRENYWNSEKEVKGAMMRNHVAGRFADAWDVARYTLTHMNRLEADTRAFHENLFGSTLPAAVIDALSSQMSTLKTNVGMLLEDGSFFGFEGNSDREGCCPLNCTHVWNYEQSLAYLFPQLERSMRETDFLHNTLPNGYMVFRTLLPLGNHYWKFKACADGQMGAVVRAYREWMISGNTSWLRKLWPTIKLAIGFAWNHAPAPAGFEWTREQIPMPWDPDSNGVMEAEQHNTYDIEFYGPNTMTGSCYLAALKAGAEMARAMGDDSSAQIYEGMFNSGRRTYDALLWNGEFYTQKMYVLKGLTVPAHLISPPAEECAPGCACEATPGDRMPSLSAADRAPKYQYGSGCLSDQLLGQYLATFAGLGHVLDSAHVRGALRSIYTHNFKKSFRSFHNVQRVYALNDEAGLLLCSWPLGNRPALPFVYSDEVWTGIEYQVAASLIAYGLIDEGLNIVRAVRGRYDGARRNPWDEEECGHHYARAMSSWALLLALSGYSYDGTRQEIGFGPLINAKNFRSFWSCGSGWGSIAIRQRAGKTTASLTLTRGTLALRAFTLKLDVTPRTPPYAFLNGKEIPVVFSRQATRMRFESTVSLVAGDRFEVAF